MNRRELLKRTFLASTAIFILPRLARAQEVQGPVTSEIGNNHGHDLTLTSDEFLALLQETNTGPVEINIQGVSGHPHTVVINSAQALELLNLGRLELVSSLDAGHDHTVTLIYQGV